ncbi:MAG: SprT family zinc-dependent metalloprotease [Pseudomonadota bacterium]
MGRARAQRPRRVEALKVRGLEAPVEIRRHPSARRMTLRVSRTQRAVIVTLPLNCDLKQAGDFLLSHLDWVRERLGRVPEPEPFAHGNLIPLRGVPHRLRFLADGQRRVRVRVQAVGDSLEICIPGDVDIAPRRLRQWLMAEAKRDLERRVAFHAKRLDLVPQRISVRDQLSRWGSCSSNGNLSFSWRLVMAPPAILNYVAAHEVAHLEEMNHGPNFWALVRKTCPAMDEARAWLDLYGIELHRYGGHGKD